MNFFHHLKIHVEISLYKLDRKNIFHLLRLLPLDVRNIRLALGHHLLLLVHVLPILMKKTLKFKLLGVFHNTYFFVFCLLHPSSSSPPPANKYFDWFCCVLFSSSSSSCHVRTDTLTILLLLLARGKCSTYWLLYLIQKIDYYYF